MYIRPLAIGALTFIPGVAKLLQKNASCTGSAAYCYGVWLKHLVMLWENGLHEIPDSIVELGPGDSIGVGLAAMLCGVNHCHALDVVKRSDTATNLRVFSDLIGLLRRRAPRPSKGWPGFDQYLDENLFPSHILTDELLDRTLSPDRLQLIRAALGSPGESTQGIGIRYTVPWSADALARESADLIISHAVLQSVADLESAYAALAAWLKPGGYMSHQIDFSCFNTAPQWNGHWTYSEKTWKAIVARRPYLINREPHSVHAELIRRNGFTILCDLKATGATPGIDRTQLAARWKHISDDDLACSGAFVQAQKAHNPPFS